MNIAGGLDDVLANVTGKADRLISEINLLVYCALVPQARPRSEEQFGEGRDEIETRVSELGKLFAEGPASTQNAVPLPSLLVDLGEIQISHGNRAEAENYLSEALQVNASDAYVVVSNPSLIFNQIALLQAKLALDATALGENFSFLAKFPKRFPEVAEGYRSLVMTVADCMHISEQRYAKDKELIHRSVERIGTKEERQDTYGLVARKLCMRTDAIASESERLLDTAENELLPRLSDKLERIFTLSQIGVARALRGDEKSAREHFDLCRSLVSKRSSERVRYACETTLLRAYAQAGFSSEAREIACRLQGQFDELSTSGGETLHMIMQEAEMLGGRLPKQLREMTGGYIEILDSHCQWITSSFILAGRYCKDSSDREHYFQQALDMIERHPVRGHTRFDLYMVLSTSYASDGYPDKALEMLRLGIDETRGAEMGTARDLFDDEVASTCSENFYLAEGDGRFVDEFLDYGRQFSIKGKNLSDASYLFLRKIASLAKDDRWKVTFYASSV